MSSDLNVTHLQHMWAEDAGATSPVRMPMMSGAGVFFRKWAILCHRWLGVALCVLFAMWFVSGIVLMYWTYPGVGLQDRLLRAEPLDASRVRLSPAEAYARLESTEPPTQARLAMFDGRPAYRFEFRDVAFLVYADNGQIQDDFPRDWALRVASAWTRQPAASARFEGAITRPDQWTVSGEFNALRPLWKFSWPDGEEVYVSQATGEVEQYTTRASRIGAYFGAIPHWLYFTPLRKNGLAWNRTVVWSSAVGTGMTIFGLVVGLLLYSPSEKRYRFPSGRSSVPYAGYKRWHTILGLFFGLVTCTWVFSGMLSMEPFDWQSDVGPAGRIARALRGGALPISRFHSPAEVFREAAPVKQLDLTTVAGEPVYLARQSSDRSLIIPMQAPPASEVDPGRLTSIVARAAGPYQLAETRIVRQYESYYVDRHHERPLPVLFIRLNDPENSMYYIDLKTGRLVAAYATGARWSRWLYHGLHSIDLPWLYRHRPAWDIAVLALMLGGTALAVTSLVIAWHRLRFKLAAAFRS